MEKYIGSSFALVFLVCSCTSRPASIGFVNSTRLMQQYHGTETKRQEVARVASIWQRSLDSLTAVVTSLQPASPTRIEQLAKYRIQLQKKMQTISQQSDQVLLKEVNAYLQAYGKTQGYDFILGATESGNIVYASDTKDLTTEVLTGLNREYDKQLLIAR